MGRQWARRRGFWVKEEEVERRGRKEGAGETYLETDAGMGRNRCRDRERHRDSQREAERQREKKHRNREKLQHRQIKR